MLAIVICWALVGLSAVQGVQYKAIAEKGSTVYKSSQTINAYIGDKDCDALIAFPTVLPCKPGLLRVSVTDSAPYPEVTIDASLLRATVRRQTPCGHKAAVDIQYQCVNHTDDQPKEESSDAEDNSSEELRASEPIRLEPLRHLKHHRRYYD